MSGHSQPLGKPVPPSFPAGSDKLENCEHKAGGGLTFIAGQLGGRKQGAFWIPPGTLVLGWLHTQLQAGKWARQMQNCG